MSAVDENTSPQSVGDLILAVEWPHKAIVSCVMVLRLSQREELGLRVLLAWRKHK